MKKLMAILAIVALLCGCATICTNGSKIMKILQAIVTDAQVILAASPTGSAVAVAAQRAIDVAQAAMVKACPTLSDVQAAQDAASHTFTLIQANDMKIKK